MSTLMSTGNSQGETGRCDTKCYNAEGPVCDCCCGGRNHGVGLEKALENTNEQIQEMVKDWKELHPKDRFIVEKLLF